MTGGVEEGLAGRATSGRPYKGGARLEWKNLRRTVETPVATKGCAVGVEALGNRSGDVRGSVGESER